MREQNMGSKKRRAAILLYSGHKHDKKFQPTLLIARHRLLRNAFPSIPHPMNIHLALQRGMRQVCESEARGEKLSRLLADGGGFSTKMVVENFGDPEDDGHWTLGTSARLSFIVYPHEWPHGLALQIFGRPLEIAGRRTRISFAVNGASAVPLKFSREGWTSFLIPLRLEEASKQTVLCQWTIENPFSPFSAGMGDDPRPLGMLVGKLELKAGSRIGNATWLTAGKALLQRFLPQGKASESL
jgi:hypothetical protein